MIGPRLDWSAPHLLPGLSRTRLVATALFALTETFTVTVVFRDMLAPALPQQSNVLAWLMSAGTTSMALVAAAGVGVSLAIRRRSASSGSVLPTALITVAWIGLGLAIVLVPLLGVGAHFTPLAALVFGAIYIISGACTVFGAEQLYNPEYFAYVRLGKQYRQQQQKVAAAEAAVEQASAAADHYRGELDREDGRRRAAIVERQALGAEAANYARILMAAMLQDPAKTGLTETGPGSPSTAGDLTELRTRADAGDKYAGAHSSELPTKSA